MLAGGEGRAVLTDVDTGGIVVAPHVDAVAFEEDAVDAALTERELPVAVALGVAALFLAAEETEGDEGDDAERHQCRGEWSS